MAIDKGSVSVNDVGAISGSGLKRERLEAVDSALTTLLGSAWTTSKLADDAQVLKALGAFLDGDTDAFVDHLVANGEIIVTTGDAAMQRDNTGGNPATLAPSAQFQGGGIV